MIRREQAPRALTPGFDQGDSRRREADDLRFGVGIAALFVVWTFVALMGWAVVPTLLPGWDASVVSSGSMRPTIRVGDVVVTRPAPDDVGPGTVVRFDAEPSSILHRVDSVNDDGTYVTQGDANEFADAHPVTDREIRGVGAVLVPWVGLPLHWRNTGDHINLILSAVGSAVVLGAMRWAFDPELDPWKDDSGPRGALQIFGGHGDVEVHLLADRDRLALR